MQGWNFKFYKEKMICEKRIRNRKGSNFFVLFVCLFKKQNKKLLYTQTYLLAPILMDGSKENTESSSANRKQFLSALFKEQLKQGKIQGQITSGFPVGAQIHE